MNKYERHASKLPKNWRFVGGMDLSTEDQLADEFKVSAIDISATRGVCWSSESDYSVSMRAVWFKGGKFYEMEAAHCSCNGYEDSWDPKQVTARYIRMMAAVSGDGGERRWSAAALDDKDFIAGLLWVVGEEQ